MAAILVSWNDGKTKETIVNYVQHVTDPNRATFVPPQDRVATFDNDGTLWCEKPFYIQLSHALRQIGRVALAHPEVRDRQPFKAVYENDQGWFKMIADDYSKGKLEGIFTLVAGLGEAFAGMTVEEFEADALDFLNNAVDPHFGVLYKQLTYQPMVELVHYLQDNGFDVWITSGGGRDFMRAVVEEIYNIPRHQAIGSSIVLEYAEDEAGNAQVVRTKEIEQPIDDGPGKPPHIAAYIGRRPIMAVGNSNGDIQMLKYAERQDRPSLSLLVHHDDADREYAYDGGAEKALALAAERGWTVISMRSDFRRVFAFQA